MEQPHYYAGSSGVPGPFLELDLKENVSQVEGGKYLFRTDPVQGSPHVLHSVRVGHRERIQLPKIRGDAEAAFFLFHEDVIRRSWRLSRLDDTHAQ